MLELFKQGCNPVRWLNIFDKASPMLRLHARDCASEAIAQSSCTPGCTCPTLQDTLHRHAACLQGRQLELLEPHQVTASACVQNVRAGKQQMQTFQQEMRELVAELKARGPPPEEDVSVAAHLLRLTDPTTGQPLSDDLLASEFGVYFAAGIESAGNALTWTMYAPVCCCCPAACNLVGKLCIW